MNKLEQLTRIIMEYNAGNAQCISCFIKVYCFARLIVRAGYLDEYLQFILNCADIPHDFGPCMEKYGHCTGDSQEKGGRSMPASCLRHLNCRRKIFSGFVIWLHTAALMIPWMRWTIRFWWRQIFNTSVRAENHLRGGKEYFRIVSLRCK